MKLFLKNKKIASLNRLNFIVLAKKKVNKMKKIDTGKQVRKLDSSSSRLACQICDLVVTLRYKLVRSKLNKIMKLN
jgi:hypothetical protein